MLLKCFDICFLRSAVRSECRLRQCAFADKILKGAKPSELPIEQPTRFELIVNAKTAKAQRIEIPTLILAQADQIIE